MDSHQRYERATDYRDQAERYSRRGYLSRDPDTRRPGPIFGLAPAAQVAGLDPVKVRRIGETTRQVWDAKTGRWCNAAPANPTPAALARMRRRAGLI